MVTTATDLRGEFAAQGYVHFQFPDSGWWLPNDWPELLLRVMRMHGRRITRQGGGPGSLEPEAMAGLDYQVLVTDQVSAHLDWLWQCYTAASTRLLVEAAVGEAVSITRGPGGVNVNYVDGAGGRYELHTDSEPYTMLLYATPTSPERGGGLVLHVPGHEVRTLYPDIGDCVIIDGTRTPHAVEPNRGQQPRLSVPMLFPALSRSREESHELHGYLYDG